MERKMYSKPYMWWFLKPFWTKRSRIWAQQINPEFSKILMCDQYLWGNFISANFVWNIRNSQTHIKILVTFLDYKLTPCCVCRILSFGWFSGVWILSTDVSEKSFCSIYIRRVNKKNYEDATDRTECSKTSEHKFQKQRNHPKERIQQY
jgi:hypothetical protein